MEKEKTFEERLKRLEEIVAKVEGEVLPLEESLKLYEEGKKIASSLGKELEEAREKIGKAESE